MRTKRILNVVLLAGMMPLLVTSCDFPGLTCEDYYAFGLAVSVIDDATNQPICDAVVKAVDGAYSEQLKPQGLGSSCTYGGAGERAGNYTLTATKSGYRDTMQSGNVVTADRCHVKGLAVTLRLQR